MKKTRFTDEQIVSFPVNQTVHSETGPLIRKVPRFFKQQDLCQNPLSPGTMSNLGGAAEQGAHYESGLLVSGRHEQRLEHATGRQRVTL